MVLPEERMEDRQHQGEVVSIPNIYTYISVASISFTGRMKFIPR